MASNISLQGMIQETTSLRINDATKLLNIKYLQSCYTKWRPPASQDDANIISYSEVSVRGADLTCDKRAILKISYLSSLHASLPINFLLDFQSNCFC